MVGLGVLYTFRRCPYAIRARIALLAANIEVEVREILLKDKPKEFLALSTDGTVPLLVLDDGRILQESMDIVHWSLTLADPENWLGAADLAMAQALIDINDGPFKQHLDRYKYATRYPHSDAQASRLAAAAYLQDLEERLSRNTYLLGGRASIADMAIFPFVRQFAQVEPQSFAEEFAAIEAWRQGWQQSPWFGRIMRKVAQWEPGNAPVLFSEAYRL